MKLPRIAHSSPSGEPIAKDKKVIDLDRGVFDGTGSDAKGNDDRGNEECEDSDVNISSEDHNDNDGDGEDHTGDDNDGGGEDNNVGDGGDGGDGSSPGVNMVQPEVGVDEVDDDDVPCLIPHRRTSTEGFLTILDINQFAPEVVTQQQSPRVVEVAANLFNRRVNVPPTDDLATHFQAHDKAVALANLNSEEVFTDIQDDSLISLGTLQVGYVAGEVGEGSSLLAGGSISQHQAEAGTSHGRVSVEDDSEVRMVDVGSPTGAPTKSHHPDF